jgi:DNA-binding response OmpR family regulator
MTKKIMILEDDEATADLLKFYFFEEGYESVICLEGRDFVKKVETYKPDLITIDILLPDSDGLKLFEELKNNLLTKDIPVIFISIVEKDKEQALKLGAMDFISKPFREEELKKQIGKILKKDSINIYM